MNYYNENDPKAAAWLRELIKGGHIAPGIVDERPIQEVRADDLREFRQCHFFAGIGGWSYALRIAGWPDDEPVWTGSCPCQPFSSAGKQLGDKDERHLWPVFFDLIRECRPVVVIGEQVASAIGKNWLDGISTDLESADYACGATVLGAHSVGAPHIRQRLYWVAHSRGERCHGEPVLLRPEANGRIGAGEVLEAAGSSAVGRLADSNRLQRGHEHPSGLFTEPGCGGRLAHTVSERGCSGESWDKDAVNAGQSDQNNQGLVDTQQQGLEGHSGNVDDGNEPRRVDQDAVGSIGSAGRINHWGDFTLVHCRDGKARRVGTGVRPLAHGVPGRVGLLRGYGNAIVPQVAAEFIRAFCECQED